MNKDIKNVAISFALVFGVTVTSSVLYSRDVEAEQLLTKQEEEYLEQELIGQQAMQLLLLQKALDETQVLAVVPEDEVEKTDTVVAPTSPSNKTEVAIAPAAPKPAQAVVTTAPVAVVPTQTQTDSAALAAQKQAQADALAQQIAQAKASAAAQAAAQQAAADAAAAKQKAAAAKQQAAAAARQSSAS
jgi:type IV secretory pathway VirB10-like protein